MLSFTSDVNLILTLFRSVSRIAFLDPHDHAVTYRNKQHTIYQLMGFINQATELLLFNSVTTFFVDIRLVLFQVLAVVSNKQIRTLMLA